MSKHNEPESYLLKGAEKKRNPFSLSHDTILILKEKDYCLSLEEAVDILKYKFKNLGYGDRKKFCDENKGINYNTLNGILNPPNANPKHLNYKNNIAVNKIPLIFHALGFNCKMEKTVRFIITPSD